MCVVFNKSWQDRNISPTALPFKYQTLSSTWHDSDPNTAYIVCISVSFGFPHISSIFPCFLYMAFVLPSFPYMVTPIKHLNVKAIVLDRRFSGLLWMLHYPKGCCCDVTIIRPLLSNGRRTDLSGSPVTVITGCQSIDYLLDFKAI